MDLTLKTNFDYIKIITPLQLQIGKGKDREIVVS